MFFFRKQKIQPVPLASVVRDVFLMRHGSIFLGKDELSAKGREEVESVGRQLADAGWIPDVVLHSPTNRTEQTAGCLHGVFSQLGGRAKPGQAAWLDAYTDPKKVMDEMRSLDDGVRRVLLVTHEPNIADLTSVFTGRGHSPEPAQVLGVQLRLDHWADLDRGTGQVATSFQPRKPVAALPH